MVTITCPDVETQRRAIGFLLGRFSGRVLRSGEHIVSEAALVALADADIPFSVVGEAADEPPMACPRPRDPVRLKAEALRLGHAGPVASRSSREMSRG